MKDHNPKSIWIFVLFCTLIGLIFSIPARALDVWTFPVETELKTLIATNLRSQPKDLWLSGPNLQDEIRFTIPAYGHLEIPLDDFQSFAWLRAVSTDNKALHLEIQSSFENLIYLEPHQATAWKIRARTNSELILFNQASFPQRIEIRVSQTLWKVMDLKAFEKARLPIGNLAGQVLSIEGEARLNGLLFANTDSQRLIANPKPQKLPGADDPTSSKRYFRLSDSKNEQSYVMTLSDPNLIQQALAQIQTPWQSGYLPRILVARVAAGHGGFNRDLSSSFKSPWSWHVAEVFRFADFASQSCDGNPEFLEQTLQSWSPDDQGVICFWNYRITEELSLEQVQNGTSRSLINHRESRLPVSLLDLN